MSKRKKIVVAGLGGVAGVGILADAASAHNGDVVVNQDCQGWEGTVTLNHNVTVDRTVAVSTNIPGAWGITGHFDSSYGQVWHQTGSGNVQGYVRLDIWRPNGSLEFTESKELHGVEGCVVHQPTPTTVVRQETTTTVPVTSTTVAQPTTSTTVIKLIPPVSVVQTTSTTTVPKQLPHTGAAGTGLEVGSGVVLLAVGVAIWKRVGSKLASQRG